jgi:hypothetical protein
MTSPNNAALLDELANAELQSSLNRRNNQPKNTKKNWDGKKKEFQKWCLDKGYPDGETVTGSKLNLFLSSEVIGRKVRKGKDKEKVIGKKSVLAYVEAITGIFYLMIRSIQPSSHLEDKFKSASKKSSRQGFD